VLQIECSSLNFYFKSGYCCFNFVDFALLHVKYVTAVLGLWLLYCQTLSLPSTYWRESKGAILLLRVFKVSSS
jgi:hypothetical protein